VTGSSSEAATASESNRTMGARKQE